MPCRGSSFASAKSQRKKKKTLTLTDERMVKKVEQSKGRENDGVELVDIWIKAPEAKEPQNAGEQVDGKLDAKDCHVDVRTVGDLVGHALEQAVAVALQPG